MPPNRSHTYPKAIIQGIGTATPERWMHQNDILELFLNHDGFQSVNSETKMRDDFLRAVYAGSGIEKRHLAAPKFPYEVDTIENVMRTFLEVGLPLTVKASKMAMEEAGVTTKEIRKLIFVTSTGLMAPGIESMLIAQLGLDRDVSRANLVFMGCAAAITALTTARDFCLANPEQKCLVVCLELFSFHTGQCEGKDMAVYMALFADGCAAVVLSGDYETKESWAIEGNHSYLIPDSSTDITMSLMERGLAGTLDVKVPKIIQANMKKFMETYYSKFGISHVDHWCIHPGGPAILKAVQVALGISDDQLQHSWESLKQYGNMSSVTVCFILDRMKKFNEYKKDDKMIMMAFGPGVWVESLFLVKQ